MDIQQALVRQTGTATLERLETLWLQLTGRTCNLACGHCYSGSHPLNDQMAFMTYDEVRRHCEEAYRLGLRRIVLTGGEPMLHGGVSEIISMARHFAPVVVMTNATLLTPHHLFKLKHTDDGLFPVEFHVSLEGCTQTAHDRIRGEGSFDKTLMGLELLRDYGMTPVIRITKTWPDLEDGIVLAGYRQLLRDLDMPLARIRVQDFFPEPDDRPADTDFPENTDLRRLPCKSGRVVSSLGVHACPMRLEAWLGSRLNHAETEVPLTARACQVCLKSATDTGC